MLPKRDIHFIKTDPETPKKPQLVMVIGLLVLAAIFNNEYIAYTLITYRLDLSDNTSIRKSDCMGLVQVSRTAW